MDSPQWFRLPDATFPLSFEMFHQRWAFTPFEVNNSCGWRCYLKGPTTWNVASAIDEQRLLEQLRTAGVEVPARSFVATAFRHLERLGVAQRLQSNR